MLERIWSGFRRYLETELQPSANGVAIFACSARRAVRGRPADAPIDEHWLYIGDQPHLYPLARIASLYPRYAAVLADTNRTRILVVRDRRVAAKEDGRRASRPGGRRRADGRRRASSGTSRTTTSITSRKSSRRSTRSSRRRTSTEIVVAGDEVIIPLLREQMPKPLAEKVVDQTAARHRLRRWTT